MAAFVGGMKFEKVEIEQRSPFEIKKEVRIDKDRLIISSDLVDKLKWQEKDRVDLLQSGSIFALELSPVGCFHLRKISKSSKSLVIQSVNLCRHIRCTTHKDCSMDGRISDGKLIFMEKEE